MFGLLVPGSQVPYHYHNDRESIIIVISGEAIEVVEGKETPIKAGDILFIPAGEKHSMINRSNQDFRYLEFFTFPPLSADFIEVK
jgi:quercetin dioxygenase-like cupin family protein